MKRRCFSDAIDIITNATEGMKRLSQYGLQSQAEGDYIEGNVA
jgi:hypothetical protein